MDITENIKEKLVILKKRVCTSIFGLKSVAWLCTLVAFILLLTNKSYLRLPVLNKKQLRLYVYCMPSYIMILPYMLITYLAGESPNIVAEGFFLLVGIALFMLAFLVGIINVLDYDTMFSKDVRLIFIPLLLLLVAIIFIVDFLYQEHWFKNHKHPANSRNKQSSSPGKKTSSSPGKKAPPDKNLTSSKKKPLPPPEKKPTQPPENKPSPPLEKKPSSQRENKPSPPLEKKPSPQHENKPSPPLEKKPSPQRENKPSPPLEKKPSPQRDNKPSLPPEKKQTPHLENKPNSLPKTKTTG